VLDEKSIEIYSSRDKIREQLIDLSKNYLQLTNFDFNKSSYLSYIINMLATLDSNLMFYVSSVYREQFLTKAVQRESVLNLANIIGYKPNFAKPSTCNVLIQIPFNIGASTLNSTKIKLVGRNNNSTLEESEEQVFKIKTGDGIEFSLIDTIIVEITAQKIIKVYQQVYVNSSLETFKNIEYRYVNGKIQFFSNFIQIVDHSETFTIPEVLPNEFYSINYNFNKRGSIADIDLFTISSSINGVLERWVQKDSIFGIGPNEYAYTYRETDTGIVITFGNGVVGKQPKKGTTVIVAVGLTSGYKGNVIAGSIRQSSSVRSVESKPDKSELYKSIELSVINKEPSQFGKNAPTIDEIRTNAINRVSTNSRLVSERDYQNADLVVSNLPVRNVFQVLKRSDLKRNEISIFTELIYNNTIVPTRNANIAVNPTESDLPEEVIIKAESTEISIDDEDYVTLFDLSLNTYTNEVNYYYYINEIQKPLTLVRQLKTLETTKILPIYSYYATDRTSDVENLYVELHCNVLDTTSKYECKLEVTSMNGSKQTYYLYDTTSLLSDSETAIKIFSTTRDDDTDENTSSNLPILLSSIPAGDTVEFTYTINHITTSPASSTELNISTHSIIVKKDLSDFMYSQVEPGNSTYMIYDVPVVKKDYFQSLINRSLFTSNVLQKIVDFNVYEYKMLTDFVNLKFANTTGYSSNMKYRSITRTSVIDINPDLDPTDDDLFEIGDRYAVSDNKNMFSLHLDYKASVPTGGYIGTYTASGWTFEKIKVNDIFDVTNLDGINTNISDPADHTIYRMIYTGIEIVEPKFEIPLEIKMVIIPSVDSRVSDQVLVKNIKDTLVSKLNPYFGYNKTLLRSVIIKTVQEITGVEHVELLEPSFNIKFEEDPYKNMTQEQLLRYTPELIYFTTENIIIELKDV
jgi:hypothetical protein